MFDNSKIDQHAKTTVLVAEKEPIARLSLSALLREEGYRVLEAGDHESAIDHMDNNPRLAVIVSDLDMARWTLIVNHARVTLPTAIVLTIAGYNSMASVAEAQELGARGYFMKPLVFANLSQTIANLLTGRKIN
jgi:DNA-binding NtrC family response regulator